VEPLSKQNHSGGQSTLVVQGGVRVASWVQTILPSVLLAQTQPARLLQAVVPVGAPTGQTGGPAEQMPCRDEVQNPPPPQRSVPVQAPQSVVSSPHPFGITPHLVPWGCGSQVIGGVHPHTPDVPGAPPPHVSGAVQRMQLVPPLPQAVAVVPA
jgi:hypothetical protein